MLFIKYRVSRDFPGNFIGNGAVEGGVDGVYTLLLSPLAPSSATPMAVVEVLSLLGLLFVRCG